ncbi:hypothetical protein [Pseudomonas vancouverensis]|uniref:Lipoprotein n=1 Tax=Pseudomonas vancouverensis TaxID=95300 RepID=A0A1H2NJK0_PSEVA|nr:hypothetical protein [Pseudomonas vancouverensis]KAB0495105.1 hypothetical protein F7R09_16110 [Pseudomonas vancouverensis]TDB63855.1 hypothetical protein EIY72_12135 [Pseudomonas vancouverensis]SDV05498.1 hypothetical protein SAMN05216558_2382 [Pseudomonas vancouverensis]
MHIAVRAAGFGLMTMFVSCGVGANSVVTPASAAPVCATQCLYLPAPTVSNNQWKLPMLAPVNQQEQ